MTDMIRYDNFLGHVFSDRYTLVSVIGTGECSVVFGAYDKNTEKTVALKMLAPDRMNDESALERFLAEIRVLSMFDHPNIVKILDVNLEGKYKFFVMEYIEGITLKKHLESKGMLSEDEILFLSRPILSALSEVHDKEIVHSDIKPQNIVLVGSGEVKLMDFGISKSLAAPQKEPQTVTVGTVQYVSPEQAEGKPMTHLSDIYSFGVMLYELATGVLPFTDADSGRIAAMHVSSTPIPPSMVCDAVSPALEEVILRAMEKDPSLRQQSARILLEELEQIKKPRDGVETPEKEHPVSPKPFWKVLHLPSCIAGILIALLLSVVVSLAILSGVLSRYTEDDTHLRVPDFVGEIYLSPEGFGLDSTLYSFRVEYVSSVKQGGKIIKQSPAADKLVKKGDGPIEITLTVSRRKAPSAMPDVSSLSVSAATDYLHSFGFEVKTVYEPHNYLPEGYVTRTSPAAGEKTKKQVTLYISGNKE